MHVVIQGVNTQSNMSSLFPASASSPDLPSELFDQYNVLLSQRIKSYTLIQAACGFTESPCSEYKK